MRIIIYQIVRVILLCVCIAQVASAEDREEFFERRIRPVLVQHCYECHSASSSSLEGGLQLDFRDGLRKGGESGPAVVPGKLDESLLLAALRYESSEMPPDGKLPDDVIKDFESWIQGGAVDPRDTPPSANDAAEAAWKAKLAERSQWWSLQPPKPSEPPQVADSDWMVEPVDRFIHAKLDAAQLSPAHSAEPEVLFRRLSFVLTGLPPRPEQVRAFLSQWKQDSDKAYQAAVTAFLDSPHFGERLARHWMDVVRYTDTYGYEWDIPAKGAFEYRDYLIRAFNNDVGFDQMIREQIAGDLLPEPRINHVEGLNESLIGPMFYHMGEHRHGSSLAFNGIHQEMIDNKVDAFSKAFLGMTVACARCHDHKLDAISQADYYALAGVFMTPRWTARAIDAPDKHEQQIAELKELRADIKRRLGQAWIAACEPLASATSLRRWALEHRAEVQTAKPQDIAWPLRQLLTDTAWLRLQELSAVASTPSTDLTINDDGSILAGGTIPDQDAYIVKFRTEPGRATLLQLEALTHESLGSRGPGRTAHGNFVLTQIGASVKPLAGSEASPKESQDVTFISATADYSQPNYPVDSAIKANSGGGWGVGLGGNVDRTATFILSQPVDLPNGGEWTIQLDCQLGTQHVLGRFRLSIGGESERPELQVETQKQDKWTQETWGQLTSQWQSEHESRQKANERFAALTDFSSPGFPDGWATDGAGMRHGHVTSATPRIHLQGGQLIAEFLDAGYHTHALSPRFPGALRLPALESFERQRVTLKLAGGEWAGRRDIPQNAFLNEGPQFFDSRAQPTWKGIAAPALSNGVTRVLTEITTASLNSNFPPRTGVANAGGVRLPDTDEGYGKLSWFSVTGLVVNDGDGGPTDTLDEFASLYSGDPPTTSDAAWQRLRDWLSDSVVRWVDGQSTPNDVKRLNWMLTSGLLPNHAEFFPEVAALVDRYRDVESTIQYPRSVNSMDERGVQPVNYRLNIRGDVYEDGPAVPRNFLEVFAGQHAVAGSQGSGRLELAEYLSSPNNPQTARVYVNRVWQWIFGSGIVMTPSDFGKLGGRPSHPELLDWLAIQFMQEGWSTKELVRRLALSQTFQQSGNVSTSGLEKDPDNRLLHHYPTRRLEAEAIRDSLLAVSQRLDPKRFGPAINPPRRVEDAPKRLFSGPLDSHGRRSLYMEMSIMQPPEFLVGFNLPDLKLPTGRRDVTNVPAQALILMNNPLVIELARSWADRLLADDSQTPEARLSAMFLAALGRSPSEQETQAWLAAAGDFASGDTQLMNDHQVWQNLAHAMFNTKEFLYYR